MTNETVKFQDPISVVLDENGFPHCIHDVYTKEWHFVDKATRSPLCDIGNTAHTETLPIDIQGIHAPVICPRCMYLFVVQAASLHREWHDEVDSGIDADNRLTVLRKLVGDFCCNVLELAWMPVTCQDGLKLATTYITDMKKSLESEHDAVSESLHLLGVDPSDWSSGIEGVRAAVASNLQIGRDGERMNHVEDWTDNPESISGTITERLFFLTTELRQARRELNRANDTIRFLKSLLAPFARVYVVWNAIAQMRTEHTFHAFWMAYWATIFEKRGTEPITQALHRAYQAVEDDHQAD